MSSPYNLLPYPLPDPYGAGQVSSEVSYYGTSLDHAVEASLLKFVQAAKMQNADKPDMRLADSEYSTGFPWLAVGLAVAATATLLLTWVTP